MPATAPVQSPAVTSYALPEIARGGHLCCLYDADEPFRRTAEEFLAAGDAIGERTRFVSADEVQATYGSMDRFDPSAMIDEWARLTRGALADGCTGLRVVADATPLVATAEHLDRFLRYEHLVDRWMRADGGFTALCAYDARRVDPQGAALLNAVHQAGTPVDSAFHLCAAPPDGRLVLDGELDLGTRAVFSRVLDLLREAPPSEPGATLRIDASALEFVDHRALLALDELGARSGSTVILDRARPLVARAGAHLDCHHLVVSSR